MSRPSVDVWAMRLAEVTATRRTCLRRAVGCVLLDADRHVLATGYNGVAAGMPHCNEAAAEGFNVHPHACPAAYATSGTNLEGCEAIHAEQNALLQCRDVRLIDTCYVTTAPCLVCTKLLLGTGCRRIVYREGYPQAEAARELWERAGRVWEQLGKA